MRRRQSVHMFAWTRSRAATQSITIQATGNSASRSAAIRHILRPQVLPPSRQLSPVSSSFLACRSLPLLVTPGHSLTHLSFPQLNMNVFRLPTGKQRRGGTATMPRSRVLVSALGGTGLGQVVHQISVEGACAAAEVFTGLGVRMVPTTACSSLDVWSGATGPGPIPVSRRGRRSALQGGTCATAAPR